MDGKATIHTIDRQTYNYGRALGAPIGADALEFKALVEQCCAWGKVAMQFSAHSCALEMALKRVRDAETAAEQYIAMTEARETFWYGDKALDRVEAGPCKWYRYGRVGDVLARFNPLTKRGLKRAGGGSP